MNSRSTALLMTLALTSSWGFSCLKKAPSVEKEPAPLNTLEGAMERCPNPIQIVPADATRIQESQIADGVDRVYYLKRIRVYGTTSTFTPADGNRGEFRGATAVATTVERIGDLRQTPAAGDFEFRATCEQLSWGMKLSRTVQSYLVLDRQDGSAFGELTLTARGRSDVPMEVFERTVDTLKFTSEYSSGTAPAVRSAVYRLAGGDLVRIIQTESNDLNGSRVSTVAEFTYEQGAVPIERLDDYVEYFQQLRDPAQPTVFLFPGQVALHDARTAMNRGNSLRSIRRTVGYFQSLRDQSRPQAVLFPSTTGVRLSFDVLAEMPGFYPKPLRQKVSYYMSLQDPNGSAYLFPGIKAVEEAFRDLGIPLDPSSYR